MDDDPKDPEPVEPAQPAPQDSTEPEPELEPELPQMGHQELRGGRDDDVKYK